MATTDPAKFPTAADMMTPSPRTCSSFSTVLEAVLIFRDEDCGVVPVLEDGKPVGVLTDRDVALAVAEAGPDLAQRPVTDFMTKGVAAVLPEDTAETIVAKFGDKGVRRLLVIDAAGQLRGILAWADLASYLPDQGIGRVVTDVVEHS
jgi:CBS domain-containing protein